MNEPDIKRALDPDTGKPVPYASSKQWLQGKVTYIGILLTTIGGMARLVGWHLPTDEIRSGLDWALANWDTIAQGVGIIVSVIGRLRIEWRRHHATGLLLLAMLPLSSCSSYNRLPQETRDTINAAAVTAAQIAAKAAADAVVAAITKQLESKQ